MARTTTVRRAGVVTALRTALRLDKPLSDEAESRLEWMFPLLGVAPGTFAIGLFALLAEDTHRDVALGLLIGGAVGLLPTFAAVAYVARRRRIAADHAREVRQMSWEMQRYTFIRPGQSVLRLQGAPWDTFYIATSLRGGMYGGERYDGEYDVVVANGYEYTADGPVQTRYALAVRAGADEFDPEFLAAMDFTADLERS